MAQRHRAAVSTSVIDAQSVKAAASVPSVSRGGDGGKKVNGRKRHIVTDCLRPAPVRHSTW